MNFEALRITKPILQSRLGSTGNAELDAVEFGKFADSLNQAALLILATMLVKAIDEDAQLPSVTFHL